MRPSNLGYIYLPISVLPSPLTVLLFHCHSRFFRIFFGQNSIIGLDPYNFCDGGDYYPTGGVKMIATYSDDLLLRDVRLHFFTDFYDHDECNSVYEYVRLFKALLGFV